MGGGEALDRRTTRLASVMRTLHVLILAGAILGAAWILKPAPVEQISQGGLQQREELMRWIEYRTRQAKHEECVVAVGKTASTLDLNDPKEAAAFRKCIAPEEPRSRLRIAWDKICALW